MKDCAECAHLNSEHIRLRRDYAAIVDQLFTTGYAIEDPAYNKLRNAVEEARVQAEIALENLRRHNLAGHAKAV